MRLAIDSLNVATREVLAPITTEQALAVLQPPPDQPENVELVPALAVRITDVPALNVAEHAPGQLIPLGLLVTDPVPLPESATVIV